MTDDTGMRSFCVIGDDIGKDIGNDVGKDALSDKGPNKNVQSLINVIGKQQLTLKQMMEAMSFTSPSSFRKTYLNPAILHTRPVIFKIERIDEE